ncbi:unnamed protein product [Linum trigynum]|uniref:Uncharacterized protein n=1 Tax=Linum trigynum TaxID=586398 RepID=A0AAV2CGN4_9ROSI
MLETDKKVTRDRPRTRPAGIVIREGETQQQQQQHDKVVPGPRTKASGKNKSGKEYAVRPKPGFKMGIRELEEMLFDKKRSNQEMMTEAESQPLPPKKLCFDNASLQDVGLENDDLLEEEAQEAEQLGDEDGEGDDPVEEASREWPREDK